jgi:hypothetical protein
MKKINKTKKNKHRNCSNAGPDGSSGCRDCCHINNKSCIDNCMSTPYNPQKGAGYMGGLMKEKIIKIEKSKVKGKKYTAKVKNIKTNKTRKISFGALGYQQFKDRTPLKLYKKLNHSDKKRQERYYGRFSKGIKNRKKAIEYEEKKSNGYYNAKILSHIYLW